MHASPIIPKTVSVGKFMTIKLVSWLCGDGGGGVGLLMIVLFMIVLRNLEWKPDLYLSVETVFPNALVQCLVAVY